MLSIGRRLQDRVLDGILRSEGSLYTDDPVDRGGPTKFGITLSSYRSWLGDDTATSSDLSLIDASTAREIYRSKYFIGHGFGFFASRPGVYAHLLDMAVLHGPKKSAIILQRAIGGIDADGVIGPMTISAATDLGDRDLSQRVVRERVLYLCRIVRDDPSQSRFLVGWVRRVFSWSDMDYFV